MAQWLPYAEWREKKRLADLRKLTPEARAEFMASLDEDITQRSDQAQRRNPQLQGRPRASNRPKSHYGSLGTTAAGADTRP